MAARNSAVVTRVDRDELGCEFGPVEDAQELTMDASLIELRLPPVSDRRGLGMKRSGSQTARSAKQQRQSPPVTEGETVDQADSRAGEGRDAQGLRLNTRREQKWAPLLQGRLAPVLGFFHRRGLPGAVLHDRTCCRKRVFLD